MQIWPAFGSTRKHIMRAVIVSLGLMLFLAVPGMGQLSTEDIEALRDQGQRQGWTFTVGENSATQYSLDQLCGLKEPENWRATAHFVTPSLRMSLPDRFDWRDSATLPPARNQGGCGSCWAFATVGALECNIAILDGEIVDLSEQWLVSCNRSGWGCGGGWWAHDYHQWQTDVCDSTGAVLEADYPYLGYDAPCSCPDPHPYRIQSWAYIGGSSGIPSTDWIKQAIIEYGPVSVAIHVNSAFQSYNGGVFNGCAEGDINHGVVLVGWDDTQGISGVWFMRNSWGPGWGEDGGYMRIPYGCSQIGYGASYVFYQGGVSFYADTTIGWVPFDVDFQGISGLTVDTWTWDFGDGDSAFVQSPVHNYDTPGLYSVQLQITSGSDTRSRQKPNYVKALADSIIAPSMEGQRYTTVEVPVYACNNVPVRTIKIPVKYSGDLEVTLDSFSTVGCRTEYFETQMYLHYDPGNKQKTIKLVSSTSGTAPDLPAGQGLIAKLYFTISGAAEFTDSTTVDLDGYGIYVPEFSGLYATYNPIAPPAVLSTCVVHGEVNGLPGINVADLTYMVDYLFKGGLEPVPVLEAGDVNCDGDVNIADITHFVDYMFGGGPPPCGCE